MPCPLVSWVNPEIQVDSSISLSSRPDTTASNAPLYGSLLSRKYIADASWAIAVHAGGRYHLSGYY